MWISEAQIDVEGQTGFRTCLYLSNSTTPGIENSLWTATVEEYSITSYEVSTIQANNSIGTFEPSESSQVSKWCFFFNVHVCVSLFVVKKWRSYIYKVEISTKLCTCRPTCSFLKIFCLVSLSEYMEETASSVSKQFICHFQVTINFHPVSL